MVNGLLRHTGNVQQAADHLTEQLREVTGARTVIVLRAMSPERGGPCRAVSVNPQRRGAIADSPEASNLFALCGDLAQTALWRAGDGGPAARVIEALDCGLTAAVPLRVEDNYIGCILALDLPDDRQGDMVAACLDTVAGIVALVLHGAFLSEQQDNIIEARTAELRSSHAFLQTVMDADPESILVIDRDYRIALGNLAARRRAGDGGDIVGHKCHEICHGNDTPCDETDRVCPLRRVLKTGVPVTVVHKHADEGGDGAIMEVTAAPIFDTDGQIVQVVEVARDIAQRVRAEDEREKLEAQLRQAQKMEAVGQLAGGIAHDFNNLLQAILGYGEMAHSDAEPGGHVRDFVEEVLKAGHRAKTLVSQLLAFSRRQVLEMEDLDLNEVIADLMKMIRRVIGEYITLDVLLGHDLGTVRADRGQIAQILTNLCVNARDAMPEGGTITIETENVRIDQEYCESHTWARPGRYVLLSVTDMGCGMDAETMGRVFEPFFTTKVVGKGTGLGLSTVYGLVKQHEGYIQVYSEVDKGTTFKTYLPVVERSVTAVGDKIEGPIPGGSETILLAEDDEMVLTLSEAILTQAGYTVLTAADGAEALSLFEENADAIGLAILDVVMPKLGGHAVFERIRPRHPDVRVLFASGYSMNAIHTNFVLDEGLALIQKPYQRANLLRKVREMLDHK
jgi:PAS domain S-box-containing protein